MSKTVSLDDLSRQSEDELRDSLRALHALGRITGSTPELTKLLRKARRQQIEAYQNELAKRRLQS